MIFHVFFENMCSFLVEMFIRLWSWKLDFKNLERSILEKMLIDSVIFLWSMLKMWLNLNGKSNKWALTKNVDTSDGAVLTKNNDLPRVRKYFFKGVMPWHKLKETFHVCRKIQKYCCEHVLVCVTNFVWDPVFLLTHTFFLAYPFFYHQTLFFDPGKAFLFNHPESCFFSPLILF